MTRKRIVRFAMEDHASANIAVPTGARFIGAGIENDKVVLYAIVQEGVPDVMLHALALNTGAFAPDLDHYWNMGVAVPSRWQDDAFNETMHVFVQKENAPQSYVFEEITVEELSQFDDMPL